MKWSAIITSLWCLVFVVWCPQSPLLFPNSLIVPSIGCVMCGDCMIAWCLIECGLSGLTVTHNERGQHTSVLMWRVVCAMVLCGVCVCERRKKSGGMVD